MVATTSATRNSFAADLCAALQIAGAANTRKTDDARDSLFGKWSSYCGSLSVQDDLSDVRDREVKLSYLLVFGYRYRQGGASGHQAVRADTVENALLAVGKGIADLGQPDPRKEIGGSGRNHPLLVAFLKSMRDKDDPSKRSYPANVPIIRNLLNVLDTLDALYGRQNQQVIDLTIAAFFWLLRPAEYTASQEHKRSQAFRLRDTHFYVGDRIYSATDASLNDVNIESVTAAALTFTDQKNAVRGEQVAQRATSDPLMCPAKALFRITQHLRDNNAPPETPLCGYYDSTNKLKSVPSKWITNGLRHSALDLHDNLGIDPNLLSARSLRPGGATALLCARVDKDNIQLLGRWKSDAMLRYLRIQAHVHANNFAQKMLDHGSYSFAPGTYTAECDMPLPQEAPDDFAQVLDHLELDED